MICFKKNDREQIENRMQVLEATIAAAVRELEEMGPEKARLGFGLYHSFHEFRDRYREASVEGVEYHEQ